MKAFNDSTRIFVDKPQASKSVVAKTDWVDITSKPLAYPPNTHSHHYTDIIDPLESLVYVEDFNATTQQYETNTLEVLMTKNKPLVSQDAENEKVRVLSARLTTTDENTAVNNRAILEIIGGKYVTPKSSKIELTKSASGVAIDANIKVADVSGLDKVFNGTTPITDLKITGSNYSVKDFMTLSQKPNNTTIYVNENGSNGSGDYISPYNSLNTALSALTTTKTKIMVQDFGNFPITASNTTNLSFLSADNATVTGNITLSKPGCIYKVCNHVGDIFINANNVVLIIVGTFSGNLTTLTNSKPYVRINRIIPGNTQQPIVSLGLEPGSVIGKFTVGLVAL